MSWAKPEVGEATDAEGAVLLAHLLARPPSNALLDRYRHAVERVGGQSLHLPAPVRRFPALVRFLEAPLKPKTANQKLLRQRLDLAMVLCETSAEGTWVIWQRAGEGRAVLLARLAGNVALDALAMPARFAAQLLWKAPRER